MMLNTDQHNPNIKDERRMTPAQFIRMTRTEDTENDPGCSPEVMREIYQRIKTDEIKMKGGDGLILRPKVATYDVPDSRIGHVVVKSLYEDETNLVGYLETPAGGLVTAVHGGHMLGVELPPGAASQLAPVSARARPAAAQRAATFQWYDWSTRLPVGGAMPRPQLLAWDPRLQCCLTTYATAFCVWACVPRFRLLVRVESAPVISALWHRGLLLYATQVLSCH